MQLLVKIDTVDKSSSMREESLRIASLITKRIDICNLILDGTHTITEGTSEIIISNTGETVRYFAGYITKVECDVEGVAKVYKCIAQDYTILLERTLVNVVYEDKTDAYILNDLFTTYLSEIDAATYVATGKTHDRIVFNRKSLKEVLDMLSADSGLDWYVDYNKNLHYFTKETNLAPFGISDDPDDSTTYPCSRLKYAKDATKLINRVLVIGGSYRSDSTDFEMPGNNQTTEFLMPYRMHGADEASAILVYHNDGNGGEPDWDAETVGVDHVDVLGVGGITCLHNYEEKLLKFETAPPDLDRAIKITAKYDVPVIVRVRSNPSYTKYSRWFDSKIVDMDIDSRSWAMLRGKGILAKHAFQRETGSLVCLQDGLVAGQQIHIVNALRGIDDDYLINRVITQILGGTYCIYEVQFGEYNPDLIDMIIALKAQAPSYYEKRADEVLNELFEQIEELTLSEATDFHSDSWDGEVSRKIAEPPDQGELCAVQHERCTLSEAPALTERATENYLWDAATTKWDFFTWG